MFPNYYGQFQGMVPNPNANLPKTGNWLPAEKYALLQKGLSEFKLSVTEEELAKGQCNHYYQNGQPALIPDQDGSGGYTCAICGTHFNTADLEDTDVKNATQNILDILNTIKIMYLSINPTAALEYFQIIPFIEKIPQLYNVAVNDLKKYEGVNQFIQSPTQNPFNMFNMMTTPGYGVQMGYQQPMGQPAPMTAPMGYPQAPVAPMGQPAPMGFNPLYGQAPVAPGYVPQTQGYAFNPGMGFNTNMPVQPQAPAAPAVPAAPTAAPVAEEVKVDTQFKK